MSGSTLAWQLSKIYQCDLEDRMQHLVADLALEYCFLAVLLFKKIKHIEYSMTLAGYMMFRLNIEE